MKTVRHGLARAALAPSLALSCALSFSLGCGSSGHTAPPPPGEDASDAPSAGADAGHGKDAAHPVDATPDSAAQDAPAPSDGGDAGADVWVPSSSEPIHYHWQLSTTFSYPRDVVAGTGQIVYDIDGEENTAATVASLHSIGPNVKVVCYVDVGTWENFRSDASSFPKSVIGNPNGWPGEKWLDVRQQSILLPIMKKRLQDWCVAKGFDAVEPDNLDGWENNPGFPITKAENLSYDTAIAAMAHSLGLSVGLKNLPEQAPTLEPSFDWALNEQCFQYGECSYFETSFIAKGKAVWDVEYNQAPDCAKATAAHLNAQRRDLNLVGPTQKAYVYSPCIADTASVW